MNQLEILPALQLNDVAFRVAQVGPGDPASAGNHNGFNSADSAAAGGQHRFASLGDVLDEKRKVGETDSVSRMRRAPDYNVITKDLQRRSVFAMAGKTQMDSLKVRSAHASTALQPVALQVALRRYWHAAEHFLIKRGQLLPVARDQIHMRKPDTHHYKRSWQDRAEAGKTVDTGSVVIPAILMEADSPFLFGRCDEL